MVEPSDWVALMVPVLKKNDHIRVCIDFSELTKSIRRERFQIPVADETFAKMPGAKCFTTLSMLNQDFGRFLQMKAAHY